MNEKMLYYTDRGDGRAKLKTPQGNIIDVSDLDYIVEVVKAARVVAEHPQTEPWGWDSLREALANLDRMEK